MTISVTVYAKETINSYYEACRSAGVTPLSFEVEAQAIARASIPQHDKGTYIIVDFGKTRTGIGSYIEVFSCTHLQSILVERSSQLRCAASSEIWQSLNSLLSKIRKDSSLIHNNPEVYESLVGTMSAIKDEIALRIQYWNNKNSADEDRFVSHIILCGGSSNLKGLPEYFRQTLNIDTKRAEVWQNAFALEDFIPPIDQRHSYGYATAVGLGLAPFINV